LGAAMRRRDFIKGIAGSITAWPLAVRAQQPQGMRRIGVLMNREADSADGQARFAAFQQALQQLGWSDGRNVRIDIRWGGRDVERERRYVAELIAQAPDVMLVNGTVAVAAAQQASRSVPIVFGSVADPVGAGFVDSLARPGGNVTGFMPFEYSLSGKWLELLKELAPGVKRAAVLRDATNSLGTAQFSAIQAVPSLGVEVNAINVRDAEEIERSIAAFARSPNGGLVVTTSVDATAHDNLIITLATRQKLPAVYGNRFFVISGGLISYAPDYVDMYRRAAGYVDRILKGEKPADLPVQAPTKYALVINLKTAKAIGLTIPQSVQARADELIE